MGRQSSRQIRTIGLAAAFLLVVAIGAAALSASSISASAQEQRSKPRTLFGLLFGGNDRAEKRQRRTRETNRRARPSSSSNDAVSVPQPEAIEKLDNARVVLVVGDFLADGMAEGLQSAYAQSPGVRVVARANGSSGFVRDDYFDWPGQIGTIMDEENPAVVLVMIGSNDRQQLVVNGNREKVRSEAWTAEYTRHVENLAKQIRQRGLPLFWIGMPPFKPGSMSTDMLAFNDIYRAVAESVGGEFIDIWDGFVDENGAFSSVGPDMNGQRVQLRGSDGINMTGAGKRKIAFYAERPLNRLLGSAASPGIAGLGLQELPPLVIEPSAIPNVTRTTPVALGDPEMDGGGALLGAGKMVRPEEPRTPVEQLSQEGIAPPAQPGRADDFSSPPYTAPVAEAKDEDAEKTATSTE